MTNWNGRELLEKTIPLVQKAIEFDKDNQYRFIVIDDCSTKNDIEFISENFPYVETIKTPLNSGFQGAVNFGITQTDDELILIMNNDIYPKPDGFSKLAQYFSTGADSNLFAVTGRFYNWDEKTFLYGNRGGEFKLGHLWLYEKDPFDVSSQTFFACGGCALWDKKKFEQLGGFDLLYHPLYYEEIDISYRALKRGWKIIYEPGAVFYHRVQSTITVQHKLKKIRVISGANNYLFTWKNITDSDLFFQHLFWCPLFLLRDLFKLKFRFWFSFFRALKKIGLAAAKRKTEKMQSLIKDKDVFAAISKK